MMDPKKRKTKAMTMRADMTPLPCKHCGKIPKLMKYKRCQGSRYIYACQTESCDASSSNWSDSENEACCVWNTNNA